MIDQSYTKQSSGGTTSLDRRSKTPHVVISGTRFRALQACAKRNFFHELVCFAEMVNSYLWSKSLNRRF